MKQPTLHIIAAALVLGYAGLSFASDNSATVFPAEGNKQCSDYAANSAILQMNKTSPSASGSLSGPENPRDADATGESAAYTVSDGKVVGFSAATTPIDYALLKSSSKISVIIYPSGGVTEDANMRLTVANVDQPITSISLCYGLGNQVTPPPPPEPYVPKTLKSCNTQAFLDATGVTCPTSSAQPDKQHTLVCNFELDRPFYGLNDETDSCCVCNSEPLTECNPNIPAGSVDADGLLACPDPAGTEKLLSTEVTTHFELNNDPYVCSTAGGIRTCFKY